MPEPTVGPVIVDVDGLTLSDVERQRLAHPQVGGVILFARNYQSPEQLIQLTADIKALNSQLVIAVDQEGGRVQRFREGFTRIPAMQKIGNAYVDGRISANDVVDIAWVLASELQAVGVDLSLAPVLDVDAQRSSVIGDRAFFDDPEQVTELGRAFIQGFHQAGMKATGKHFPGHGGIQGDTHTHRVFDPRTLNAVLDADAKPFTALAKELDAMMPAHVIFSSVCDQPVGFSSYWLNDVLRQHCQFDGVVFSDDLSMEGAASAGGYEARAEAALNAGCTAILVCNNPRAADLVLQHLAAQKYVSPSPKLNSLLTEKPELSLTDLRSTPRWQQAQQVITRLEE